MGITYLKWIFAILNIRSKGIRGCINNVDIEMLEGCI